MTNKPDPKENWHILDVGITFVNPLEERVEQLEKEVSKLKTLLLEHLVHDRKD